MRISLGRPSRQTVEEFLSAKLGEEFSYDEVGMTRETGAAPTGYIRDHYRVRLGEGALVFDQAVAALKCWAQFDLGWVNVSSTDIPIAEGSMVGLLPAFSQSLVTLCLPHCLCDQ